MVLDLCVIGGDQSVEHLEHLHEGIVYLDELGQFEFELVEDGLPCGPGVLDE